MRLELQPLEESPAWSSDPHHRALILRTAMRTVHVHDSSTKEVNDLRRALITAVPTLAVASIDIRINTSSMYDEVLALQLGLTPLICDPSLITSSSTHLSSILAEALTDSGSKFRLRVSPPVDPDADGPRWTAVRAADLVHDSSGECICAFPDASILFLLDGVQEIDLIAWVKMDTASSHAKHAAFSEAFFTGAPRVTVNPGADQFADSVISACFAGVFSKHGSSIVVSSEQSCVTCMECVKISSEAITISESQDHFILFLRPTGRISVSSALCIATS